MATMIGPGGPIILLWIVLGNHFWRWTVYYTRGYPWTPWCCRAAGELRSWNWMCSEWRSHLQNICQWSWAIRIQNNSYLYQL